MWFLSLIIITTQSLLECSHTYSNTRTHTQIYVSRTSVNVSSFRSAAPSLMSVRGQSETVKVKGTTDRVDLADGVFSMTNMQCF